MILSNQKSDNVGAIASTLCLVHCVATPFLFMVQSCSLACSYGVPVWWKLIDYFFLIISFFAVYRTTQTTTSNWMKPALWLSWGVLCVLIINEKLAWFPINEKLIYLPVILLIALHLYHKKYCQCNVDKCCANGE